MTRGGGAGNCLAAFGKEKKMKHNVWVTVLSALLIVGVLVGATVWLGKGTSGGGGGGGGGSTAGTTAKPEGSTTAKPAETTAETTAEVKRKTVVTNANAKYGVRKSTNEVVYVFYSDELKPNTAYSIVFNFAETDHGSFVSEHGLTFRYTIALDTASATLGDNLIAHGGMSSGYYYNFETNENGAVVFGVLRGAIPTGDSSAQQEQMTEICHYIRDNLLFQISEIVG